MCVCVCVCVCVHVCQNYYNYYYFFTFIYVKCAENVFCLTPHFTFALILVRPGSLRPHLLIVLLKMKYGKYHCKYSYFVRLVHGYFIF